MGASPSRSRTGGQPGRGGFFRRRDRPDVPLGFARASWFATARLRLVGVTPTRSSNLHRRSIPPRDALQSRRLIVTSGADGRQLRCCSEQLERHGWVTTRPTTAAIESIAIASTRYSLALGQVGRTTSLASPRLGAARISQIGHDTFTPSTAATIAPVAVTARHAVDSQWRVRDLRAAGE